MFNGDEEVGWQPLRAQRFARPSGPRLILARRLALAGGKELLLAQVELSRGETPAPRHRANPHIRELREEEIVFSPQAYVQRPDVLRLLELKERVPRGGANVRELIYAYRHESAARGAGPCPKLALPKRGGPPRSVPH